VAPVAGGGGAAGGAADLVETGVALTDLSTSWGLVTVLNEDQTINRQFTISAKDTDEVATGNRVIPPGCTEEEWFSGRVFVASQPFDVGEGIITPEGKLLVNCGVDKKDGVVNVKLLLCDPEEFRVDGSKISTTVAVKADIDVAYSAVTSDFVKG
jgi:hypothetical protein